MICQAYDDASNSTCDSSCAVGHPLPLLHLFISHHFISHRCLVIRCVRVWVSLSVALEHKATGCQQLAGNKTLLITSPHVTPMLGIHGRVSRATECARKCRQLRHCPVDSHALGRMLISDDVQQLLLLLLFHAPILSGSSKEKFAAPTAQEVASTVPLVHRPLKCNVASSNCW
jgi:hypothetical protein